MKKILVVQYVLILIFLFVSCKSSDQQIKDFPASTNPSTEQFKDGYHDFGIDVEPEQDYSNIVAYTEFESYNSDFEIINITVKNNNPGKGFYIYITPLIEKKDNDKWVRLDYQPLSLSQESKWGFCGIEGDKESPHSTRIPILSKYLNDEISIGDYRAVIFVGDKIIYAPFKIIK